MATNFLLQLAIEVQAMAKSKDKLQQENALLKSEIATLKNIIALMPGNVYWKDKRGQYLGCNNNMAKIGGLKSRYEIIGMRAIDLVGAQMAEAVEQIDNEIMNSNEERFLEENGKDVNGNPAIYLTKKIPLHDIAGNVIGLLGVSLDITERKKIEKELIELRETIKEEEIFSLKEIISLMPGNVYWKDKEGILLGCNDNLANIFGLNSRFDIVGKNDEQLISPELAKLVIEVDVNVMKSNKEVIVEEIGFDIKKHPAIYLTRKAPLHNKSGEVVGIVGISFDITERKQMEEELRAAKEKAEAALKAKELAETESREKSMVLKDVLQDLNEKRYYLAGKYHGTYLTTREAQCVPCLARGLSAKEIGNELGLSKRTVEVYINNLKAKFNCNRRSQLITAAIECRFLDGIKPL